jgi:hypothetical protein
MEWATLDFDVGRWLKPRTKNGLAQYVPLPRQAIDAIRALPRKGAFVFSGAYEHSWSDAAANKTWARVRRSLGLSDVWLHDFRRTVATRLYEAEEDELLVKACLNHYDGRPIAIYVRLNFDRLARALQAQADRLWALPRLTPVPPIVSAPTHVLMPAHSDEPDVPLESAILETWGRQPAHVQEAYIRASRRLQTPLRDLLMTAVDQKLRALAAQYSLQHN